MDDIPASPMSRASFDPPPEYRRLRLEQPISRVKTPRGDAWLVTRREDIRAILIDRRFSADPRTPGFPPYIAGDVPARGILLQADGPDVTRLRLAVSQEFMATHVEELRPLMQQIVDGALEEMLKRSPPVDLVESLALPVASQIICELLGAPSEDHPFIKNRADIILDRSRSTPQTDPAVLDLVEYFEQLVTAREVAPSEDDLLGRLLADAARQGRPNHHELVSLAALLMLSAYDTLALAIGLGAVTLLQHPDQLADLMGEPSLAENLADELARYLAINHAGLPRAATEDVIVGGQLIRAGEGILVMLSFDNTDEAERDKDATFDIHRRERTHVRFGHSLYQCLGVRFAQAQLQIAFNTLFLRIPTLRLARPVEKLSFRHEMVLYGLQKLPVTW